MSRRLLSRPLPLQFLTMPGEYFAEVGKPSIVGDGAHLGSDYKDDPDARMCHILHSMVVDGHAR